MANRRMFAKTIIDSDAFLEMPTSTQCLYFHLSMRADDEGFINNPKKIQRIVGASEDDLKLLIMKRFLIPFESGIVVIKHWKIHNYIQKDRFHETSYLEEKAQLYVKENDVYTLDSNKGVPCIQDVSKIKKNVSNVYPTCIQDVSMLNEDSIETNFCEISEMPKNQGIEGVDTKCIQDGYKLDTEDRLGKVSLDEVSLVKVNKRDSQQEINYQTIINLYHDTCVSFPHLRKPSTSRIEKINARLKSYNIEDFKLLFAKAEASDFLKGKNDRNWKANFDWLLIENNMLKVLEGNYDNRNSGGQKPSNQFTNFSQRDNVDYDDLLKKKLGGAG